MHATFKRGILPRFARLQIAALPAIGFSAAVAMALENVPGSGGWIAVWLAALARTAWVGVVVCQDRSGWTYRGLLSTRFFGRDDITSVGLLDAVAWNGVGGFIRLHLRDGTSPSLLMLGQLRASRHVEFMSRLKKELETSGEPLPWDLSALELHDEAD